MVKKQLIYDVGVNIGTDTAYYILRGYKVLGIEANPVIVSLLQDKFSSEIESGTFTLLNLGIAKTEGEFEFWVCDDHSDWSSFDRSIASRNDARHHSVMVKTRQFFDIITEHGVPFYCKIDIEGHDRLCLTGLTPKLIPAYISIEMSHKNGDVDINLLHDLGYKKFKIISQINWAQPTRLLTSLAFRMPDKAARLMRRVETKFRGRSRKGSWVFPRGSSGPFAEDTAGQWRSRNEVLSLWRYLRDLDIRSGSQRLGEWYDIHASL
jgi:FkbM family methyltransferase